MNKKCTSCNDHFSSDGELICSNCRVRSLEFKTSKRNFYKDRKAWNDYANESLHAISTCPAYNNARPILRRSERVVSSDLSIHSDTI